MREVTRIYTEQDLLPLGAAMYLAVVAYPDDISKRNAFVDACKAWIEKTRQGGRLKSSEVTYKKILDYSDTRKIYSQFSKVERIIFEKRLPALTILRYQMMSKAVTCTIGEGQPFSINKWIERNHVPLTDEEGYHRNNFYNRVWSPSKSIIHLVGGLANSIPPEKMQLGIEWFLLNPFG